jgi:3-phosphoshikimate 1-carboxyvinyltransferase
MQRVVTTASFQRGALTGTVRMPGDKSISHRALMFGAIAHGTTRMSGLNSGEDVAATRAALTAMGAQFTDTLAGIDATGVFLRDPAGTIDARNSGTTARLLMGLCAGSGVAAMFDGDDSLRRRPMERIAGPLRHAGACVETTAGRLPVRVVGIVEPRGGEFALEVPSAQIKSAILLAHIYASGRVRVTGDRGSRDHSERMLRAFGREIEWDGRTIDLWPGTMHGIDLEVPGDLSAAAFFLVAAAITPDSRVTISGVGMNPTRSGIIDVLTRMGARIEITNERVSAGEPMADLTARTSALRAITVDGELVVRAIDEIPVIAVAAAFASGTTRIRDAAELRVKESDRLSAMARILRSCGVPVIERDDGLDIDGGHVTTPNEPIETHGDHRIAMIGAVLGAAVGPVTVDDGACAAVSYPAFSEDWRRIQTAPASP